jgi:hypothetical protein
MTRPSRVPTHMNVPYGSPLAALPRVIVTILLKDGPRAGLILC